MPYRAFLATALLVVHPSARAFEPSSCFVVSGDVTGCAGMSMVNDRFLSVTLSDISVSGTRCTSGDPRPPSQSGAADMQQKLSRFTELYLDTTRTCAEVLGSRLAARFVDIPCGRPGICTLAGKPLLESAQ